MRRWLCLAAVVLLAGCLEPPVWTVDVPGDAPAEGGPGPRRVEVRVTDGTAPLAGAAVLFVWLMDPSQEDGAGPLDVALLGLRAAGGTAVGHVPADRPVHVLVGHGDGWTEEWTGPLPAGEAGQAMQVRLYARHAYPFLVEGTWQAVGVGADLWPYVQHHEWSPSPLPLDPDEATNHALQARMARLSGTLRWDNAPTGFGDLGVLVANRGQDVACAIHDDERELAFGPADQPFYLDAESFGGGGCPFDFGVSFQPPIDIGPATRSHVAAPLGLPYRIEGEAHLVASYGWQELAETFEGRGTRKHWVDPDGPGGYDPRPDDRLRAPGAAVGVIVASALVAAMVRRRLGR